MQHQFTKNVDQGPEVASAKEINHHGEAHPHEHHNENERLLVFSDGIIAFALTIIVVFIKVEGGKPAEELPAILQNLLPDLGFYFLSFLAISVYWKEHHRIFSYLKRSNTPLVLWNLLFLALIVLVPVVNHLFLLTFNVEDAQVLGGLFIAAAGVLFAVGLSLLFLWWYACRHPHLFEEDLSSRLKTYNTLRLLTLPLTLIVAIIALFLTSFLDNMLLLLAPILFYVVWLICRRLYRRRISTLPAEQTVERMIVFTDAVIGIAITLAMAQVELPAIGSHPSSERVLEVFSVAAGHIGTFLYGFVVLGTYWLIHYVMFRYIKRYNAWLIFFNFAFLLCCILLYIPISVFSLYLRDGLASQVYYSSQVVTLLMLCLIWFSAARKKSLLNSDVDERTVRNVTFILASCLLVTCALTLLSYFRFVAISYHVLAYGALMLVFSIISRVRHGFKHRETGLALQSKA